MCMDGNGHMEGLGLSFSLFLTLHGVRMDEFLSLSFRNIGMLICYNILRPSSSRSHSCLFSSFFSPTPFLLSSFSSSNESAMNALKEEYLKRKASKKASSS